MRVGAGRLTPTPSVAIILIVLIVRMDELHSSRPPSLQRNPSFRNPGESLWWSPPRLGWGWGCPGRFWRWWSPTLLLHNGNGRGPPLRWATPPMLMMNEYTAAAPIPRMNADLRPLVKHCSMRTVKVVPQEKRPIFRTVINTPKKSSTVVRIDKESRIVAGGNLGQTPPMSGRI